MHTFNHKTLLLVLIVSLSFLSAKCTTPAPRIQDTEQCSTWFKIVDKQIIVDQSACNCRLYRFDSQYIGAINYTEEQLAQAIEEDVDHLIIIAKPSVIQRHLSYCHTVVGWSNRSVNEEKSYYALVTAYWDAIRKWLLSY